MLHKSRVYVGQGIFIDIKKDQRLPTGFDALSGGGAMGELCRKLDWSKSSLGPVDQWPQSLVGALSICLNCQFPIAIYWGPDKTLFYNDAWRPIVGNKHPGSFGSPAREVWPEIWDVIGPLFKKVDETGHGTFSTNQLLLMHRFGYTEECYFDFTFSPIKESTGGVGGIFNAVLETTFRTLSERRSKTLSDLAAKASFAQDATENCRLAAKVLAENPADVPFSLIYLSENSANPDARLKCVASSGVDQDALAALTANLESVIAKVARSGQTEGLAQFKDSIGKVVGGAWPEPVETALVLPLLRKGQRDVSVMGAIVLGVSPRRAIDLEYKAFFEQLALHLSTSVLNALSYQEEKKRAEALAEIDRAKTAFFSNVSHEFRTPLTLMLGPLEDSLADGSEKLTAKQRERQQLAYRNALRLLKLVNSLLDFSRIEAGRANAVYRPTDLARLTTDIASVFRSAIEKAGLKFKVNTQVIEEPVYVDREMWEKVVLNLLSNAFKFTFTGEIEVALQKKNRHVELRVRDTGTGIAAEELPLVFGRFHRIEGAQGRSHEGSGIGLALIQEIVKLHHGAIRAESRLGQGSTFIVEIPLGKENLPREHVREENAPITFGNLGGAFVEEALRWLPESARESQLKSAVTQTPSPEVFDADRHSRILLADDNSDMREYVRDILSGHWAVDTVADGEAALERARANPPDLILSDIMMPKLNGFELLKALRDDPKTSRLPVIFLSARAGEEATVEALQSGADDYLVKPFSAKELLARVNTQLKIAKLRKEAVTLQLQTEKARQELFDFFMQAPAPLVILLGPEHRFYLANPPYENLIAKRKVTGKTVLEAFTKDEVGHFVELLDEVYHSGKPYNGSELPLKLADKNGLTQERFINVGYQPFREADGKIKGILAVHQDVTEQVIARRGIEKMAVDLKASLESRDEFLSIASHELKTPITSIKLQLQMTKRRIDPEHNQAPPPQKLASIVETALKQTDRLTSLVEDLLDVSRIQAGKLIFNFQDFDLGQLIQEVVESQGDQLETANCKVALELQSGLRVRWDAGRVEQLLVNLISNAVKYAPASHVSIRAWSERGRGFITVQDSGPGIRKEDQERVFKRFARATPSRNISGLGLGLYIVKEIVEGHHGKIHIDSEPGRGTKFSIEIPLVPSPMTAQLAPLNNNL